jgi:hypothetical protein
MFKVCVKAHAHVVSPPPPPAAECLIKSCCEFVIQCDTSHAGDGRLRVTFCRGLYHDAVEQATFQAPDLIFAPNAGKSSRPAPCAHLIIVCAFHHLIAGKAACSHIQLHAAGLAAYPSWAPTLQSLPVGVPALCTDYCEEAALRAAATAVALTGSPLALPVAVNPFRRPASSTGRDNALPSLSNGFMFGIVRQPK